MQSFTVQVKDNDRLKALNVLETKRFTHIIESTGWYFPALTAKQ